jgi:selenocysteine-specific elongation factor
MYDEIFSKARLMAFVSFITGRMSLLMCICLLVQEKHKEGVVSRIAADGYSAVCSNMFKKETDINAFVGLTVVTGRGEEGKVSGRFGTSGKFTVDFSRPLAPAAQRQAGDSKVVLKYKRFVFDTDKRKLLQ